MSDAALERFEVVDMDEDQVQEEPSVEEEAQQQEEQVQAEPAQDEDAAQQHPEGAPISTKDGKHTIPYEVLAETRRQLQDLKRQNELLQQLVAQQQAAPQPEAAAAAKAAADLLQMDKDAFRTYVSEKGVDALYELREQLKQAVEATAKTYTVQAMQRMSQEAKARVLQGIVNDWADENKDLLQNPTAAELMRAFDRAMFAELGVKSIEELGPMRARKHLDAVAEKVRRVLGALGAEQTQAQATQGEEQPQAQPAPQAPPSLEALRGSAGASARKSLGELSGFELEMQMAQMSPEDIEKLFDEEE